MQDGTVEAFAGYVPDLMDRSKLRGVRFCSLADLTGAPEPSVVVDLSRPGALASAAALVTAGKRVVGFNPHVGRDVIDEATAAGIQAMPRSELFRRWPDV
jgi:hypothetical protein